MNIRDKMTELNHIGSDGYTPTDEVVDQLASRTRRNRAARKGGTAFVGSVAALALGVLGAQVLDAFEAQENPGFQDRNLVERSLQDYLSTKFQQGNGAFQSDIDFEQIYKDLDIAAQVKADKLAKKEAEEAAKKAAEEAAKKTEDEGTDSGGGSACEDDYDSYDYKYFDCSKGKWVVKDGWYKDEYGDHQWYNCATDGGVEHPDQHVYYDCTKGKWKTFSGYFMFFDGEIYACAPWLNHHTGQWFYGNYSPSYDKVAICPSASANYYEGYVHLYGKAEWISTGGGEYKCKGTWEGRYGAPYAYNCITEDEVMTDPTNYKWWPGCSAVPKGYVHKDTVIEYEDESGYHSWEWNGAAWVETTPLT